MLDKGFHFLLNNINHRVKILYSIPIVRKWVSGVSLALLQIFTLLGPPMILQSDNGHEFSGVTATSNERKRYVGWTNKFLTQVINEIHKVWLDF